MSCSHQQNGNNSSPSERIGSDQAQKSPLYQLGLLYKEQGRYAEALTLYYQILEEEEGTAPPQDLTSLYQKLGDLYLKEEQPEKAQPFCEKALSIWEDLKDQAGLVRSYLCLSEIYSVQGDHAEALTYAQQALALGESSPSQLFLCYEHLGKLYRRQQAYPEVMAACQNALMLSERLNDPQAIATCLTNLALLYQEQTQYD